MVVEPTEEVAGVPTAELPAAVTATPTAAATTAPEATQIPPVVTLVGPATTPTPLTSAPGIKLRFAGQDYVPLGYRFCQAGTSGEPVCVDLPAENPTMLRIAFARGDAAQITIDGPKPDAVEITYLTDTGILTGTPEVRPGDNAVLFIVTPEAGSYIMALRMIWGADEVTYYYRVSVTG
jgi:hypothetical protein